MIFKEFYFLSAWKFKFGSSPKRSTQQKEKVQKNVAAKSRKRDEEDYSDSSDSE